MFHSSRTFPKLKALLFTLLIGSFLAISCSDNTTSAADDNLPDDPTGAITLSNNGASAYVATEVTGEGVSAETDAENPVIELMAGSRVTIVNEAGASSHPLVLRSDDGESLLAQRSDRGSFADDESVNAIFEGNSLTFTVTEPLAAELADYICAFHPGMNGEIRIAE